MNSADITLIGGGMVGAATALALAPLGLKIDIIEAKRLPPFQASQAIDLRVSALYHGTVEYLKSLQVWPTMQNMRVCPFTKMSGTASMHAGMHFDAHEFGLDALGYFTENRVLQLALLEQLQTFPNVTFQPDTTLVECSQKADKVFLKCAGGHTLETSFLLGCDGAHSVTRILANIGMTRWQYNQHCLTLIVKTKTQHHETWQAFTAQGPRAFLPLPNEHAALVWYDMPERLHAMSTLSHSALSSEVRATFPKYLVDFELQHWGVFPLHHMHVHRYISGRIALLGDAAHVIHPLAGQGVNLGFKDVQTFAQEAQKALQNGTWMQGDWLHRYGQRRQRDNLLMQSMMDALHVGHVKQSICAQSLMKLGFGMLKVAPMKHALGHYLFGVKKN